MTQAKPRRFPKRFTCSCAGLALFLSIAGPATAQEILLDFEDGLLPSAHGWTFHGQDDSSPPNPIPESRVASVSAGVLLLDTAGPFGVGSDNAVAVWEHPLLPVDPANFVMEIRMRASLPDGLRAFCGGFLGADVIVIGKFLIELSLMPRQLTVNGLPGATCATETNLPADGRSFHTYRAEVRNGNQATVFVDGVPVATGTLALPAIRRVVFFGDVSPSGGNVRAEIDFLRLAALVQEVDIDVKPGSDPNSVNPRSRGVIPVAILTTSTADGDAADLDAWEVDPLTLAFGPGGAGIAHTQAHAEDVDADGDLDMVVHFRIQEAGIACGDREATLTGQTLEGEAIEGADSIRTVGCRR